jgi:type II secretory pathway pseudopilin PulG
MPPAHRRQGGFTFLWLLFYVAGLGVGMAALGTLWHTAQQREKEAELLFVGDQYRRAIESFLKVVPPGQASRLPQTLDELLLDPRFPHTLRHLRRAYFDPLSGDAEWGLLKDAQGGIGGVFSLSDKQPFKTGNFPAMYDNFAGRTAYNQWQFVAAGVSGSLRAMRSDGLAEAGVSLLDERNSSEPRDVKFPETPNTSDPTRISRIFACQKAMEQDYHACTAKAMGNGDVLSACTDEATARHQACLAGI